MTHPSTFTRHALVLAAWCSTATTASAAPLPEQVVTVPAVEEGPVDDDERDPGSLPIGLGDYHHLYLGQFRFYEPTGSTTTGGVTTRYYTRARTWAVCDAHDSPIHPAKFAWLAGDDATFGRIEKQTKTGAWVGRGGLLLATVGFVAMGVAAGDDGAPVGSVAIPFALGFIGLSTAIFEPVLVKNHQRWFSHYYTTDQAAELLGREDPGGALQLPIRLRARYKARRVFFHCEPGVVTGDGPEPFLE